jgi:hypothetical protein
MTVPYQSWRPSTMGCITCWSELATSPTAYSYRPERGFTMSSTSLSSRSTPAPLPLIVRGRAVLQPYQVVHARPTTTSWDLLVKWKNSSPADVSWEQLKAFKEAYPDFQLEDKLFEPEGDDVMDSYLGKQHSRRRKTSGGSHSG